MLQVNRGLSSLELALSLLENNVTRKYFGGVVARDVLCKINVKPVYIVCNTDVFEGPGKHWITFFFPPENCKVVEMFDSLGKTLYDYPVEFANFVNKFNVECVVTPHKKIQPQGTFLCGYFCLYYILLRCKGLKMKCILDCAPLCTNMLLYFCKENFLGL